MARSHVIRGNALELPLPAESVDLVVTSPPYFGLRSYQDDGEHYAGQIGAEASPAEFVAALIAATTEMVRVLKPSGSLWVNLGDKYAGSNGQPGGAPVKSLIGVPWRYAIRCIDDLGLILRAEIIWSKPNGLPESVRDRVRRSHETWFHFTRSARYYSAVDEIREPYDAATAQRYASGYKTNRRTDAGQQSSPSVPVGVQGLTTNPLGKLPGSVWSIPTQALKVPADLGVDHFAAFPMEWPRRIIRGWSPDGVCTACGEGRRPVVDRTNRPLQQVYNGALTKVPGASRTDCRTGVPQVTEATITGYACACPEPTEPTTPAVVLDPFGGTGTTALVAKALGRVGLSVDMSADYCRLAQWRTTDAGQLAKATNGKTKRPRKAKPTDER